MGIIIEVCLGLAVASTVLWALRFTRQLFLRASFSRQHGCQPAREYPRKDPLFGIDYFLEAGKLSKAHKHLPASTERHRKVGKSFWVTSLGSRSLHTIEPANIQTAYSDNTGAWSIGPARLHGLEPFCGKGFITTDGDTWAHSRRLINPIFAKSNIADLEPFATSVDRLLEKVPKDGSTVDLQPLLSSLFLDTATQFLLGRNLGVLAEDDCSNIPLPANVFLQNFGKVLMGAGLRMVLGRLNFVLPRKQWQEACNVVHRYIDYHIERVLSKDNVKQASSRHEPKLGKKSLVVELAKQTGDSVEIRNQILQGMMAAQDTTSHLLSNTLFLLSRHPSVWEQVREEALGLGPDKLDYDSLRQMDFLGNVLRESLRLYPVFPGNGRTAVRDTILPLGGGPDGKDPVLVHRNASITVSFYAMHRNERVFGPDVESFIPDRWKKIDPSAWEYMPFGGGSRACMGRHKATVEASYVIVRLALMFRRLDSRDDREWAGMQRITARNANGCNVSLVVA